jgi:predicted nucleotidyltransferase
MDLPSGRFVLRIDQALHASLRHAAREEGVSLNEICSRRLAFPDARYPEPAREAVNKAVDVGGEHVLGVVAFGSWAREEMAQDSDIDVLVVLEDEMELTRSLYRAWDPSLLQWNGHPVEPHFVHLPEPGARISGLWAEVAVDGVVLFDRALVVSRRIVEFRRRIASGEVVRRRIQGQSYWVEVS